MPSPFTTVEVDHLDSHGQGFWLGQHKISKNLVIVDREWKDFFPSPVGIVTGMTGSGKSGNIKIMNEGVLLSRRDVQCIFFDRSGEYVPFIKHHGGEVIKPAIDSDTFFNPLDLADLTTLRGKSLHTQIGFKIDAMLAQAEASASHSGATLSEEERSIITRCVEHVYEPHLRFYERDGSIGDLCAPRLEDFYDALRDTELCPEPLARKIALKYERYVKGIMSFFNHDSNVDFTARVLGIDLSELQDSMVIFALINSCEALRNRLYSNHAKGILTYLTIEELQSFFKYPAVLHYFSRFINEGRKLGLRLTGATTTPSALLASKEARDWVLQADYIMLFKQTPEDRIKWQELLKLSDEEVGYFDEGTPRGEGLGIFGAARVPIDSKIPTDNYFFEIIDTDPRPSLA
jgi:type IV secretory pathway VirB4 component